MGSRVWMVASFQSGWTRKTSKRVGDADDGDEGHDAALQPAEAGEVEREDGEDQRRWRRSAAASSDSWCADSRGRRAAGPKSRSRPMAAPRNSARSVAMAAISAATQRPRVVGREKCLRQFCGRVRPVTMPELGREVLDEHRHGVRPQQHPEQPVAELRAAQDVGGEVAGIDVGDRGDEGRAEVAPHLVALEVGQEAAARRPDAAAATRRGGAGRTSSVGAAAG